MATIVNSANPSFAFSASGFFAGLKERIALNSKYRATVREMSQLTRRDLDDLGIAPYDIPRLAREHVYGE